MSNLEEREKARREGEKEGRKGRREEGKRGGGGGTEGKLKQIHVHHIPPCIHGNTAWNLGWWHLVLWARDQNNIRKIFTWHVPQT